MWCGCNACDIRRINIFMWQGHDPALPHINRRRMSRRERSRCRRYERYAPAPPLPPPGLQLPDCVVSCYRCNYYYQPAQIPLPENFNNHFNRSIVSSLLLTQVNTESIMSKIKHSECTAAFNSFVFVRYKITYIHNVQYSNFPFQHWYPAYPIRPTVVNIQLFSNKHNY